MKLGRKIVHSRSSNIREYTVVFQPVQEGGYDVIVPAIPEICTFGSTLAEARKMASDAIRCYLESLQAEAISLPRDIRRSPQIDRVSVRLPSV